MSEVYIIMGIWTIIILIAIISLFAGILMHIISRHH